MKKLLLSALAICAFSFANAQEETTESTFGFAQGDIIVEGNLGLSSSKDDDGAVEEKMNTFNFNPKAGYFVTDDLAVGVQLSVGSNKNEISTTAGSNETKTNSFGAGVFARYYFLELGKRFKVNTELGLGFSSAKYDDGIDGTNDEKLNGFGAGLGLGLNYFVKDNIAITFGLSNLLSFQTQTYDDGIDGTDDVKLNEFNANINVLNNFFTDAQFGLLFKF